MRTSRATGEGVTQTKQTKIGPCEQVRVNWKTAAWLDRRPRRLESRREIGEGTRKGGPGRNDYRPRQCCHVWLQDSVRLFAPTRIPSSRQTKCPGVNVTSPKNTVLSTEPNPCLELFWNLIRAPSLQNPCPTIRGSR